MPWILERDQESVRQIITHLDGAGGGGKSHV